MRNDTSAVDSAKVRGRRVSVFGQSGTTRAAASTCFRSFTYSAQSLGEGRERVAPSDAARHADVTGEALRKKSKQHA